MLTPQPGGPALEPAEQPKSTGSRPGLGLVLLVAIISALLSGALGGTLGYVFASRKGVTTSQLGSGGSLTQRPPDSLAGVAKKVLPSVVTVAASRGGGVVATGSGFVVSSDGYLITNDHVVIGSVGAILVRFNDGNVLSGRVVGTLPESDVAVVKIDKTNLPAVEFGDSDAVQVGDPVLAVGSPQGLYNTVTSGIVSAVDRPIELPGSGADPTRYYAAIQTDATIDHGSSGGPLFDAAGRVIGVTSSGAGTGGDQDHAIGLNFAIPINQAKRIAQEIISTGAAHRTVIGASFDSSYQGVGVKLGTVDPGGPAANAGLRTADVLVRIEATPLEQPSDAIALIRKYPPGAAVTVQYQRAGESHTVRVTLVADTK